MKAHLISKITMQYVASMQDAVDRLGVLIRDFAEQRATLNRLIDFGEKRRMGRVSTMGVEDLRWDGNKIEAKVQGIWLFAETYLNTPQS